MLSAKVRYRIRLRKAERMRRWMRETGWKIPIVGELIDKDHPLHFGQMSWTPETIVLKISRRYK